MKRSLSDFIVPLAIVGAGVAVVAMSKKAQPSTQVFPEFLPVKSKGPADFYGGTPVVRSWFVWRYEGNGSWTSMGSTNNMDGALKAVAELTRPLLQIGQRPYFLIESSSEARGATLSFGQADANYTVWMVGEGDSFTKIADDAPFAYAGMPVQAAIDAGANRFVVIISSEAVVPL